MLVELRQKAQVTIPKEIIVKLGLSEGDKLEIFEKDGFIYIMPVVVYPKHYLNELKENSHLGSSLSLTAWTPCLTNWKWSNGV